MYRVRSPALILLAVSMALPATLYVMAQWRTGREQARPAGGSRRPAHSTSGILDFFASSDVHDRIERLVLEDRYVEAFELAVAEVSARAGRLGPQDPETLASLQWAAAVASLAGDRRTADELFEAILAVRRRTLAPDDPVLADTLVHRGRVARLQGDLDLARRCYTEAGRILAAGDRYDGMAAALEQAEAGLHLRTDLNAALESYTRALESRRRAMPAQEHQLADNLTWLGWTLDRLGRPLEAAPYLLEARTQLRRLGLTGGTLDATLQQLLADQLVFQERWEEAEPLYAAAAATNAAMRLRHLGGFARRSCPPDGFEALALSNLRRGRSEEAWVLLQKGRAPTHRDFGALGLWPRREPETFRTARALRAELVDLTHRIDLERRTRGVSVWEAETWRLQARALELRARLSTLESHYLQRHGLSEPSLERTRALLGPRTALLGWLEVYAGGAPSVASVPRWSWGYVYVLRSTGPVRWIPLWAARAPPGQETPRGEWGPVFARVRRAAQWPARVDSDPLVVEQLRTWTRHYLDPALAHLEGVDHLIIEGTRVPVETFRDADGRFILDRFDVTYTPSAAFLTLLAERGDRRTRRAPRTLLSIAPSPAASGSPDVVALALEPGRRDLRLTRTSFDRGHVSLDRLPHLPFAGIEARSVARFFSDSTVLQGGTEVEREVERLSSQDRLKDYDVVHIATHTLTDGAPERCALALAERTTSPPRADDGLLDVEEILLGWELDGAMLTLSACESARAGGTSRGEELGFTPALFAAGAGSVLVSLWPVDDRATAILMDRFYQDLTGRFTDSRAGRSAEPLPPASALREAKIHLMRLTDRAGHRPFEHPAYWGGFILVGLP